MMDQFIILKININIIFNYLQIDPNVLINKMELKDIIYINDFFFIILYLSIIIIINMRICYKFLE
jgi:Trk-type K+ transport system membrane component